ncbi:MAG: lysophospholipid acyltransferase family protein [Phycisphaeraceae bacterium]
MTDADRKQEGDLPRNSPRLLSLFARYVRRYVGKHFNAVRVLSGTEPELPKDSPVVFYVNHPGWWDPLMMILLATARYPERQHYAPFDAAMLRKYAFFERLGFFGVEQETRRGAARLLRAADAIMQQPGATLWITAEGRFTDVRDRPIVLRPGLAHIARRMPHGYIVPLALEYTFWEESTPEALIAFGEPIDVAHADADRDVEVWQDLLQQRLEHVMARLAEAASSRRADAFERLIAGRQGVGGIYDLWRRLKFWSRGRRFDPSHSGRPAPAEGRKP